MEHKGPLARWVTGFMGLTLVIFWFDTQYLFFMLAMQNLGWDSWMPPVPLAFTVRNFLQWPFVGFLAFESAVIILNLLEEARDAYPRFLRPGLDLLVGKPS
jgi:hypothetical protein